MPSLSSGSHGDNCDPACPAQPADGDHGHLMTSALESMIELPTSLARPSQRGSVATRVKLLIQQHPMPSTVTLTTRPEGPSRRPATRTLVASDRLFYPPQSQRASRRQSKHIGQASCSGLVQSIFSPPARPPSSSSFLSRTRPRRRAKNALHYAACGIVRTPMPVRCCVPGGSSVH